ncbi:hypothetical protein [Streptomyces sp. NPDC127108]|uniref:hypothetical protein n=1 Tax=Streptomyces sp. NPDC127108 TaxID=3345361 RepID=UPI003633D1DC
MALAVVLASVLCLTQCSSASDSEKPRSGWAERSPDRRPTDRSPEGGEPSRKPSASATPSSPSSGGRVRADLERRVTGYTSGFSEDSGYRRPSARDRRTVAEGVALLLDRHRSRAERRLADVDFRVRTVVDTGSGRRYAEVSDLSEDASAPRGWGRVYVDLDSPIRWSVQVPHPVADRHTERLGAALLSRSPGGVMVIAGAHRKAGRDDEADVAHRRKSVFHAICDELAKRGVPGIQVHGMADDSAPKYDVVASTGKGREAVSEGRDLADALRRRGYDVCRAWARSCPLEGRKNVQGRGAAAQDTEFLHVEFGARIRDRERHLRAAVSAMASVTRDWRRM